MSAAIPAGNGPSIFENASPLPAAPASSVSIAAQSVLAPASQAAQSPPAHLPENAYSSSLLNASFEEVLQDVRLPRNMTLQNALLGKGVNEDDFLKSLTSKGREQLYQHIPPPSRNWEALGFKQNHDVWEKEIKTAVWRRGKRYWKIETLTVLGTKEKVYRHFYNFFGAAFGGIANALTLGSVKSLKKYVDERCLEMESGIEVSDPRYQPIDQNANPDEDLGYDPEKNATLDAAWSHYRAVNPHVLPFPKEGQSFVKGQTYRHYGHLFIFMDKGHILFAPKGSSSNSYDVSFYSEKSGKAWKNGNNLKDQINFFIRGAINLSKELKDGEKHIVLDIQNRKVWAYKSDPDFEEGFTKVEGRQLILADGFWERAKQKIIPKPRLVSH